MKKDLVPIYQLEKENNKLKAQNKEMLDIMIECYWYVSERGDNLVDEIQTIIEKITGKTIDEALKK